MLVKSDMMEMLVSEFERESGKMSDNKPVTTLIPTSRLEGDAQLLSIRGEIDLHNSPELRGEILRMLSGPPLKKLILNLGEVPYMDSSAIAVLVEALQKMRKVGGRIFLTNLQPRVKGLLEIARLDSIFVVVKDEAEALAK